MTLQPGQWAFYILDVSNQNNINVTLNDTTPGSQSVLLRLYASASSYPTQYSYSYVASVATQSLQIQNVSTGFYYFGVYFPVAPSWLKPATFTLLATASGSSSCLYQNIIISIVTRSLPLLIISYLSEFLLRPRDLPNKSGWSVPV